MKLKFSVATVTLALQLSLHAGSKKVPQNTLTREDLYKNLSVPLKREFPQSKKVAPCEDFHKYVCSEVEEKFKLPGNRSLWFFSFSDNSEKLLDAKKEFFHKIEEGFVPSGDRIQQVKNFYLACMNPKVTANEERDTVQKIQNTLNNIKTIEDFKKLMASNIEGVELSLVNFQTDADQKNPKRNDILLLSSLMTFPERSYYHNEESTKALETLSLEFYKTLKLSNPEKRAQDLLHFEKELAEKFPLPVELRTRSSLNTYKPKKHFLTQYPNLKLEHFLARIPQDTKIRDIAPESLKFANDILVEKNLELLKNVYLYHSLASLMDDAYPDFQKKYFEFQNKQLGGPAKRPERNERCTKMASGYFVHEVDAYLTPILFPQFPKENVVNLVSHVRQSILKELDSNKWLSLQAKKEAKNKMLHAKLFLVQPENEKEWNFAPRREYSATTPLTNTKKIRQALLDKNLEELKIDRPRDRWDAGPLTLNAYYSPADNKFVLLQGILQDPFYGQDSSPVENFGAIGSVVGHELGHGIDDQGSLYNAKGELSTWMTKKDQAEFKKITSKFIARFNAIGHNGELTLGENIGDSVGIRAAYNAAFHSDTKIEATIENKKKFFESYARMWCSVVKPDFEKMLLKTDPHSMGRERINQQVIHLDGFYEAYACKQNDKMYVPPSERIQVW